MHVRHVPLRQELGRSMPACSAACSTVVSVSVGNNQPEGCRVMVNVVMPRIVPALPGFVPAQNPVLHGTNLKPSHLQAGHPLKTFRIPLLIAALGSLAGGLARAQAAPP